MSNETTRVRVGWVQWDNNRAYLIALKLQIKVIMTIYFQTLLFQHLLSLWSRSGLNIRRPNQTVTQSPFLVSVLALNRYAHKLPNSYVLVLPAPSTSSTTGASSPVTGAKLSLTPAEYRRYHHRISTTVKDKERAVEGFLPGTEDTHTILVTIWMNPTCVGRAVPIVDNTRGDRAPKVSVTRRR